MKIKTEILKEMVSKAIKGAGCNGSLPLTTYMGIELKNNILSIITTDGNNELVVRENILENMEDFYTVVDADLFSKLISKVTDGYIEINNNENYLGIKTEKANYKLPLGVSSTGNLIKFDDSWQNNAQLIQEISTVDLQKFLLIMRCTLADLKEVGIPCLTGYYFGNNDITTNRVEVCYINNHLFNEPVLISSEMGDLLQLFDKDIIKYYKVNDRLLFETENVILYGPELEGNDIYPIKNAENIFNLQYDGVVNINKQNLLNIIDRMTLFLNVNDYMQNGIYLRFTENKLTITSQQSNATEEIDLETNVEEFLCLVDVYRLKALLQNIEGDKVEVHIGQKNVIMIKENEVSYMICLQNIPDKI